MNTRARGVKPWAVWAQHRLSALVRCVTAQEHDTADALWLACHRLKIGTQRWAALLPVTDI
jgi:hypothetical protein